MVNDQIDPSTWRERLKAEGCVQIQDYLQPALAERIWTCLVNEVPWTLALRDDAGARTIGHDVYSSMTPQQIEQLLAATAKGARSENDQGGFRFAYDSYMMVEAYLHKRDPGLLLHDVLELLNSREYVAFVQALTGDIRIRRVNAQATRYRSGHFLRYHTDIHSGEGRLYAYVINLTREWRADWGGLLQFIDAKGEVTRTFMPRWNSLSLFAVPAGHAVSLVSPWANSERLAITGWMLL